MRYNRFIKLWKIAVSILLCSMIYKYFILYLVSSMSNFFGVNLPWDALDFGCNRYYQNTFSDFEKFGDKSDYVKCIDEWKQWLIMTSNSNKETGYSILLDFATTICMLLTINLFDQKKYSKP